MKCSVQKLLVPVDLGEASLNSLAMAVTLARKCDAHIYLLNVSKRSGYPNGIRRLRDFNREDHDFVYSLINATGHLGDFSFDFIHAEGEMHETIIQTANSGDYDLLIMGMFDHAAGCNGSQDHIEVSVINYLKCPVLLVPQNIKPKPFKKVLFPIHPVGGIEKRIDTLLPLLPSEPLLDLLDISAGSNFEEKDVINEIIGLPDKLQAGGTIRLTICPSVIPDMVQYIIDLNRQQGSDLIVLGNEVISGYGDDHEVPDLSDLITRSGVTVLYINESPVHMLALR